MKNKKFLIIGAGGQLGREFHTTLMAREISCYAPREKDANITDSEQIGALLEQQEPDVVINCAAYNAVDTAEEQPETAMLVNKTAVENLARLCQKRNMLLVHFSSDYVFNGRKMDLYNEDDQTDPLCVYGQSKLAGEKAVMAHCEQYLIFRLSWVIGKGTQNFLYKLSQWADAQRVLKISADETSVPTFTHDIVDLTLKSIKQGLRGLYHATNSGYASRYELAKFFIRHMELPNLVIPVAMSTFATKATRPLFSSMSNKKISDCLGVTIPHWEESLLRYMENMKKGALHE